MISYSLGIPVFPTGGGLKGAPMFHASTDSLVRGGIRPKPPLKAPTSRPPPPPRSAVPPPPPPMQPPPPPPPLPPHRAAPPVCTNRFLFIYCCVYLLVTYIMRKFNIAVTFHGTSSSTN